MPERPEFDATDVTSHGGDGEQQRRWYHRLGPAVVAAACGLAALVVAIVTAPSDTVPRLASPQEVTGVALPSDATPPPAGPAPEVEPEVLGISEEPSDAGDSEGDVVMSAPFPGAPESTSPAGETIDISVNGVIVPSSQPVDASIVNGALRSTWTFSGAAVAAIPGDGQFVTVDFYLTGAMRFAPDAGSVLDLRCVEGDCPDGSTVWTSLPAGQVEPGHALTLVVRSDLAHDARFELRSRPDPASYVSS